MITTNELERMPLELLHRIASFLRYSDVLQFSRTSKLLYYESSLGLSSLKLPSAILHYTRWSAAAGSSKIRGDIPRKYCSLPLLLSNNIKQQCLHTIIVSGTYVDQGWGKQKGRLYIIGSSSRHKQQQHRIVAVTPMAPHGETKFSLEIPYYSTISSVGDAALDNDGSNNDGDETFHLWYSVGGGGGHSLTVFNLFVEAVVFDDVNRLLSKNFNALGSHQPGGSLPPVRELRNIKTRILLLQQHKKQIGGGGGKSGASDTSSTPISTYFESIGICTSSEPSLVALDQIVSSLIQIGSDVSPNSDRKKLALFKYHHHSANKCTGAEEHVTEVLHQLFPTAVAAADATNSEERDLSEHETPLIDAVIESPATFQQQTVCRREGRIPYRPPVASSAV